MYIDIHALAPADTLLVTTSAPLGANHRSRYTDNPLHTTHHPFNPI